MSNYNSILLKIKLSEKLNCVYYIYFKYIYKVKIFTHYTKIFEHIHLLTFIPNNHYYQVVFKSYLKHKQNVTAIDS